MGKLIKSKLVIKINILIIYLLLISCSMQTPYKSLQHTDITETLDQPAKKINKSVNLNEYEPINWWQSLGDPAIEQLISKAFENNPTLAQALASITEARAEVIINEADYWPKINGNVTHSYSNSKIKTSNTTTGASNSLLGSPIASGSTTQPRQQGKITATSLSPALSWEIDLFGRISNSVTVANSRLDASLAEAKTTKLLLATQIASNVIDLRACWYLASNLKKDIISKQLSNNLVAKKIFVGLASNIDGANSLRDLSLSENIFAEQSKQCAFKANALAAMVGIDNNEIIHIITKDKPTDYIPTPPKIPSSIPALILTKHPRVITADHQAKGAWYGIGVARAAQFPIIDLASALSGQWIKTATTAVRYTTASFSSNIIATLFDAGKKSAAVDVAEARYQESLANLNMVLRTTVQELQDALANERYTNDKLTAAKQSVTAAELIFKAGLAKQRAGLVSMLELEEARRNLHAANSDLFNIKSSNAYAWIRVISAAGGVNLINKKK